MLIQLNIITGNISLFLSQISNNIYPIVPVDILITLGMVVPLLLSVAFLTLAERKGMGAMQRRVGPNVVGRVLFRLLQPFADAVKLLLKEVVLMPHASKILFLLAPIITLIFSLLPWGVIPFSSQSYISDMTNGIIYILAVASIRAYGTLLARWAPNSKYSFLGCLRRTAQILSFEVSFGLIILVVVILSQHGLGRPLNMNSIIFNQLSVYNVVPVFPIMVLFFISTIAETQRPPFDIVEAESEIVAGHFTEYSRVYFVCFFLGEYAAVIFMSAFTVILFFGGWLNPRSFLTGLENVAFIEGLCFGLKVACFLFIFIAIRAALPRIRFDHLMLLLWTRALPCAIAFVFLILSFAANGSLSVLVFIGMILFLLSSPLVRSEPSAS